MPGAPVGGPLGCRFAFETLVNLVSAFPDQKQTTDYKNQVAARDIAPENCEERRCEAHDPGERHQQKNPRDHGQREAEVARAGLLGGRQFARQNTDENDVVDPEHDLENGEGDQRNPTLWRGNPVHRFSIHRRV